MKRSLFVLALAATPSLPRPGAAQALTVPAALARLFDASQPQAAWFSANFLSAVPLEKVQTITAQLKANLGAYESATLTGGRYTLTFARGSLRADAALDANGAFTQLLVNNIVSTNALERITALLRSDAVPAAWFSDQFLAKIPIAKTNSIIADMKTRFGTFRSVTPNDDGSYDAAFSNGTVNVRISLDAAGKIEGLLFHPV